MNAQKSTATTEKKYEGFTDEERAAMKERAKELKAAARRRAGRRRTRRATCSRRSPRCRNRIAPWPSGSMPSSKPARRTSRRNSGTGCPRTPRTARSSASSRPAEKFKSRYATFGFNEAANLDEGTMWPTAFALTKLTAADEARIGALVKKAVSWLPPSSRPAVLRRSRVAAMSPQAVRKAGR